VNYGAIGVVIGHEISHGFDDQGAQFDASGRLLNRWTDADLKSFQERGLCVVNQFDPERWARSCANQGSSALRTSPVSRRKNTQRRAVPPSRMSSHGAV
jgi:predicted metalloendopeptidase